MIDKELLKGWTTEKILGKGTFGTVYEVSRVKEDGTVEKSAVKVIKIPKNEDELLEYQTMYTDDELPAYFETQKNDAVKEFETMQKFSNDRHIVSFYEHEVIKGDDGQSWTAVARMELLTPLTTYIKTHSLKEKDIVNIGIDMCRGLETLNDAGVVHRDIKYQNIFVDSDRNFKLGDFGTARSLDHTTMATKKGTIGFMAPEVYNNEPCNQTLDYYSVGLVLYWLLNERRLPFLPLPPVLPTAAKNEEAIARRMNGEKAPEPKFGCERLKKVIAKAIEFDPEKRYKTATEMKYDLIDVLQKEELDTLVLGVNGVVIGKTQTESIIEKTVAEPLEAETFIESTVNETLTVFESAEKKVDTESKLKTAEGNVDTPSDESVDSDTEITETLSVFGTVDKKTENSEEPDIEKTVSVFDDKKDNTIKEDIAKKISKVWLLLGIAAIIVAVVIRSGALGEGTGNLPSNSVIPGSNTGPTGNIIYWGVDYNNILRFSSFPLSDNEIGISSGEINVNEDSMPDSSVVWKDVVGVTVKDRITPVGEFKLSGMEKCIFMDLKNLDTSKIIDMSDMFTLCSALESIDLSGFDTSNVRDMSFMFVFCKSIRSLNLGSFNTSNVTNMASMFYGCERLQDINLGSFDTSNVTNMTSMFYGCERLQDINLSSFDTSNVTSMCGMFTKCCELEYIDLSSFNTSNVTDMTGMFKKCMKITSLDLSNFDTYNVTSMHTMFDQCVSLKNLNVSSFNTENATDMQFMFSGCVSLENLDLSNFIVHSADSTIAIFCDTSLTAESTNLKVA